MRQILSMIAILGIAAIVPPSVGPIESAAFAQKSGAVKEGRATSRIKRVFDARVATHLKTCPRRSEQALLNELDETIVILVKQVGLSQAKLDRIKPEFALDRAEQKKILDDQTAALSVARRHYTNIEFDCMPRWISAKVKQLRAKCELELAKAELAKLEGQLEYALDQLDKAISPTGTEDVKEAITSAALTVSNQRHYLNEARGHPIPKDCDKRKKDKPKENVGGIDDGGETIVLEGMSGPATELPDPESDTDYGVAQLEDIADRAAWLLGDWQFLGWERGTLLPTRLRFRLDSDGTLSATVHGLTQEMADKGYSEGMQILRGITDPRPSGGTWTFRADNAQIFSPKDPRRDPGQTFGQSEWYQAGVIFVDRASGELGGSTGFGNRLNFHRGELVRPDLTRQNALLRQIEREIERLIETGDRTESLAGLRDIARQLRDNPYSSEAREAATFLDLLLDRETLLDDPDYRQALLELEDGADPETVQRHLRAVATNMVQKAELFARPLAGNDYGGKLAAYLFLGTLNASRLRDDLANPRGAINQSNMSRMTQGLSTIKGLAGLARNPKEQNARSLMHGVRDLATVPAARAGLTNTLDFPGEVAASLLQQSVEGFGHISNAVKELRNAVAGDPSALRRIAGHARKVDATISSGGYGRAITDAVTNRIASRVPFLRSAFDMISGP